MPDKSLSLGLVIGASLGASFGKAFKSVEQRAKSVGDSLKQAKIGSAISGDLLKYKRKLDLLKKSEQLTGVSSDVMKAKIAKAQFEFNRAARKAGKYGIEIGNAARQHSIFERSVSKSEKALKRFARQQKGRTVRSEMKGQALGLLGGAYALSRQFSTALKFEEASTRLDTVLISKNIGQALIRARAHAVSFARKGLASETEVLDIQYALSSAGFEAEAARAGSGIVSKVATVTKGASEQVGEVMATVFNNLGDSLEGSTQQKLERIGDLLTKTQFKFQLRNFGQLGESLKLATPTLSQYNIELAQGVTIMGAMNSAGLQGTQAGTAFAATMRNMSKASEELGFELVRNEKGQFDFIATMENLSDAIGGFDGMDQETIDDMQKIFGEEGIRGVTLLGKRLGELSEAQDDVAKSSKGIVNKSYNKFVKSAPGQLKIFGNNMRLIGMTLAGSLLPALNSVLKPMIGFAQTVGKSIQQNPMWAKTFMAIGGALIVAKVAFMAWNLVATASPVGLVITALAVGASLIIANWGAVKSFFLTIWEPIEPYWQAFANGVGWIWGNTISNWRTNWGTIKNFFLTIWDPVKTYWEKFSAWVGKIWDKISAPFKAVSEFGKSIGSSVANWFADDDSEENTKRPASFKTVTGPKSSQGIGDTVRDPFSGDGGSGKSAVKKATTAAALSSIIAASPVAAANNTTSVQVSAPITVHAAPGMDEQKLADLIDQRMAETVRQGLTEAMETHD